MAVHKEKGFSILEALISVAIFSVAVLGTVKFQIESSKNQAKTHFKTLALYQIYDMVDRIKANAVGFSSGAYHNPSAKNHASCLSSRCSSLEMAEYDYYEWNEKNATMLPSGSGHITCSGNEATVSITWNAFEESKSLSQTVRIT